MSRALNLTSGQLWISQQDGELARVTLEMQHPVRYLWGLFATLRSAIGEIEFEAVRPGVWMLSRFQMEIDLRLLAGVKSIRSRIRRSWVNWRPVAPQTDAAPRQD